MENKVTIYHYSKGDFLVPYFEQYVEEKMKNILFRKVNDIKNRVKHELSVRDKINYLEKQLLLLKNNNAKHDFFIDQSQKLLYTFKHEENTFRLDVSVLTDILEDYPNKERTEHFSCSKDLVLHTIYGISFDTEEIQEVYGYKYRVVGYYDWDEEEYYKCFERLKGDFISDLSNFILFEYFLKTKEDLGNKDTLNILESLAELKSNVSNIESGAGVNLSNTKGTEKIIMLHQLGILEFLKQKTPFNTSTNALASVISGITGIKQTSVYPMINPIFKPELSQKNNPLKTNKKVNETKQKLVGIGYTPTK